MAYTNTHIIKYVCIRCEHPTDERKYIQCIWTIWIGSENLWENRGNQEAFLRLTGRLQGSVARSTVSNRIEWETENCSHLVVVVVCEWVRSERMPRWFLIDEWREIDSFVCWCWLRRWTISPSVIFQFNWYPHRRQLQCIHYLSLFLAFFLVFREKLLHQLNGRVRGCVLCVCVWQAHGLKGNLILVRVPGRSCAVCPGPPMYSVLVVCVAFCVPFASGWPWRCGMYVSCVLAGMNIECVSYLPDGWPAHWL